MSMSKFISCREFLEKKQKNKRYQNCLVRILLDSCVSEYFIFNDEDGITICLGAYIEL